MASDKRRPSTPSWRTEVPGATERKREAMPGWKKEQEAAGGPTVRWDRKTKIGVGTLSFLVFNALLIWVIYWLWPPKPACLVLIGAGYETNLAVPHNVYGWNSLDGLADLSKGGLASFFGWGSSLFHLKHDPREFKADPDWDKGLANFQERTAIIFLALHGAADSQGAYLLPQDYDWREEKRLRLASILDKIKSIPEDKKKVLILDATQVPAHWPLGMLQNDFARGLNDLKEQIERIPNLVVLSASDVDQRSWPSEEFRKTIFAHYVIEGLKGAADDAPTGDQNGRITAAELHEYVLRNVERWARANRNALQTPVLLGGKERAENIELAVVVEKYQPPSVDEPTDVSKELAPLWKKYHALAKSTPPPTVYTPHLWRLYQDRLLRYEQLLRAGDRRGAPELKKDLDRLEEDLVRAQRLDLNCAQNSIALPNALGQTAPWSAKELDDHVTELFKATPDRYEQLWETMQKTATDHRSKQLLRLKLGEQLLKRAAESPRANLEKVCTLLRLIGLSGNQRPIEAHFAAMLQRDLDKKQAPPEALIIQALLLRRLAENVALSIQLDKSDSIEAMHPYSEAVFPWIRDKVEAADDLRRKGEDRLFATERESWNRAGQDLQEAEKGYRKAQVDGDTLRSALAVRDEVLLALPYYAQWQARRRSVDEQELKNMEELWKDVHYLVRLLEAPEPRRIQQAVPLHDLDLKPRSIAEQTKVVSATFKELEEKFKRQCDELSGAILQSVWRDTDDALSVPRIEPDLRMKLLTNAKAASRTFHLKTVDEKASDAPGVSKERNDEQARGTAQRQGRMALAVLGQRWFDDPALSLGRASEKYTEVEHRIQKFHIEERWWTSLARAAEEIGVRYQRMPEDIVKLTESSRKTNLKQAAGELLSADRLARQIDGFGGQRLVEQSAQPVDEYRKLHLHDLFLWLAERTRTDHWFGEEPATDPTPYYQAAGLRFVQDARTLIHVADARGEGSAGRQAQQERLEAVTRMEGLVKQPGELSAATPGITQLDVTSERRVPLEFRLQQAKDDAWVPPGFPVVWLETGKFLQTGDESGRRVLETADAKDARTLRFEFTTSLEGEPPRVPRADKTSVTLNGLYRGQIIRKLTPVNLHRLPETVVFHQPTPDLAGIAVRADPALHNQFAPQRGAIAIALDCSGSMWVNEKNVPWTRSTPSRYHEATQALRKVLETIDDGVSVSVIVFAHKTAFDKEPRNAAETDKIIELVRPPEPWNKKQLDALMDRIEILEPWNKTPIVRAMVRAKEKGFPKNVQGFKSLVVLTDGDDTLFHKDDELNPSGQRKIGDFIEKEFKDFGVVINIVGFKVEANEKARFQEQFQDVVEKRLPLKGKFYTVDGADDLKKRLIRDLKQKLRFKIEKVGGGPVDGIPEDGWDISRDIASDSWAMLPPGPYYIMVQSNRALRQRIHLARGDFLLATVTADGIRFERSLRGDDFTNRPHREQYDWLLTLLQSQYFMDKSLEMLIALEDRVHLAPTKERDGTDHTLEQVRPVFTWMELKPQSGTEPAAIRWGIMPGHPAPTWGMYVPAWPDRATPGELSVWWNWQEAPPVAATLTADKGADFRSAFRGQTVQVGTEVDKIRIDSVDIERRPLETRSGIKGEVSCLVVRASYPRDNPIWIQLEGIKHEGDEHHYYTQAGKYTGVFWPIKQDDVTDKVALKVVALDKFKKSTRTSNMKLPFVPDSSPRPQSVPQLLGIK